MGWVNPWVGLGWVQLKNWCSLFIRYWFICYVLLNCNSKQAQSHTSIEDGTVGLSYLDVRISWIDKQFQKHYAARSGCKTLWSQRLIMEIIAQAVNTTLAEYTVRNMGWVGLGPFAVGWVGSTNMDQCPSLKARFHPTIIGQILRHLNTNINRWGGKNFRKF